MSPSPAQFSSPAALPLSDEVRLHVWLDTSLQELTALILTSLPPSFTPLPSPYSSPLPLTFSFSLIYPDKSGSPVLRHVGHTLGPLGGADATKTLRQCGLEVGDSVDVAIGVREGKGGGEEVEDSGAGNAAGAGVEGVEGTVGAGGEGKGDERGEGG